MRDGSATAARKRVAMARFPLISQRAEPLTASPKGEASLLSTSILIRQTDTGEQCSPLQEFFDSLELPPRGKLFFYTYIS